MTTFAQETIGRALGAAARLAGATPPAVPRDLAESAVRSERHLVHRSKGLEFFAPLSRLWPAQDGWVRTHANYPWHRAALLAALDATSETVADAIAGLPAAEVEARVYAAGGLATRLRTPEEWRAESGLTDPPLTAARTLETQAPPRAPRTPPTAQLPLAGVRVLDLTRVLAGPTCTRLLGALGADVLRIDDPRRPELEAHQLDALLAKRSAFLTLPSDTLTTLLRDADVVITGYRPHALARFGLAPEDLACSHPGLVITTLSAWGDARGWEDRRGFDSLVQVATGIAHATRDGDTPGALPYQALDHGTGYLMAAATADLLHRQRTEGGTHHAQLALAHTAAWVLRDHLPFPDDAPATPVTTRHGGTTLVPPPVPGSDWPGPPRPYGGDAPAF